MMLATRVGAGIAAEIGSMVVTEQIDALRMNGVDPVDYLIVPRFLASLVMTGVLTTIGVGAAIIMGALTAYYSFHLNPIVFLDPSHVRIGDLLTAIMKCGAYGAAIPIVAGVCGLSARGGSEGVGVATTRAVISASFVVIVLDFFLSGFALFTFQRGGN
jgi:phospholipid/cholesterol/gamma-HCH transport system permease protein